MSKPNILLYRTNLPALQFSPNDLIGSRLYGGHLGSIEYIYPVHGYNIHSLATVNYQLPRGETLFHLPLTNILENIQRLFRLQICLNHKTSTTRKDSKTFSPANLFQPQNINNPKIFKDFFACKFILTTKHQQPENIQRLFRLQICLRRKSSTIFRKYSKTFWATNSSNQQQQSTAAINSSHQQQQPTAATNSSNQQQQSTAATSSSNQQQKPAAAINSSHQQQQSTAATSNSNQQQQPATAINSSNQQQQPAAAISNSNQQQQPKAATSNNNQLQQQPAFVLPAPLPPSTTTHVR